MPRDEQLLDVEITLRVPAADDVGVSELVDKRDLWMPRDHGIKVHLLEDLVLVFDALARDDFEPAQQRLGLRPAMGLDNADHDVDAGLELGVRALQHFVGLADAGGGAYKNLQLAERAVLPPGRFQERLRRGTLFGVAALICHAANIGVAASRA